MKIFTCLHSIVTRYCWSASVANFGLFINEADFYLLHNPFKNMILKT